MKRLSEIGTPWWHTYDKEKSRDFPPDEIRYTREERRELVTRAVAEWERYRWANTLNYRYRSLSIEEFVELQGV